MRLKRLTPQAFDRAAADTRMGDQAREMARAVLVDGRAQVDVATEHGMSKQRVSLSRGHYRAGIQENYDAGREFHSRGAGSS
jgi:hypothetical protein